MELDKNGANVHSSGVDNRRPELTKRQKELARRLYMSGRRQVVIAGMETHVCVFQTVRDLAAGGYQPFVARDAVCSRTSENHETGLALMREAGATISSTEGILFDLLGAAGTPEFKAISPLLK